MPQEIPFEPTAAHGVNIHRRKLNPHRLLKRDMIWLWVNTCKAHRVAYIQHPKCFFDDLDAGELSRSPIDERIGFFDIEASNLKANFGYMFSYCIKNLNGSIISRVLTTNEIRRGTFDKRLCRELCHDMAQYDKLVVYWGKGTRFDLPFCRSRCLYHETHAKKKDKAKYRFPEYMELYIEDLYDTVRSTMCLHRRRMETVADFLEIPTKEHRLNYDYWVRAMAGDRDALSYILKHNQEDVITLEACWKRLHRFAPRRKSSV